VYYATLPLTRLPCPKKSEVIDKLMQAYMTPATKHEPTAGALRAAKQIEHNPSFLQSTAELIDRETGVRELTDILENIITEVGDLIESRSPELAAQARAALRRCADATPRHQ